MALPKGRTPVARHLRHYAWQPPVFSGVFFALTFAAVLYFLQIAGDRENAAEAAHSRHLAMTAIGTVRDDIARRMVDYAWWDDMVNQSARGLDPAWADSNIGKYLQDEFDYSGTFLVDPGLNTVYATSSIKNLTRDALAFLGPDGRAFLTHLQAGAMDRADTITAFVHNTAGVFLVAAAPVTPEKAVGVQLSPHPRPVLIFHRRFDEDLMNQLGRKFLLTDLHLVPAGGAGEGVIELTGLDGRPVASAAWIQGRPGDKLIAEMSLKVGVVMGVMAMAAVFLAYIWVRMALAADVAKSRFLAKMSHELLTPLNPIIGFAQVMRDQMAGPLSTPYVDYAGHIHRSGLHLLALVRDILDYSRIETGRLRLDETSIDLGALVRELPPILAPGVAGAGPVPLSFQVDLDASLPNLRADGLRVRQVLINILSNAAKFGAGRQVVLRAMEVDGAIRIEVEDQGIGIAQADLGRAFEPFIQVDGRDGTAAGHAGGMGVGLPIARELMEMHGGSLELTEGSQGGTRAIMRFPACRTVRRPAL